MKTLCGLALAVALLAARAGATSSGTPAVSIANDAFAPATLTIAAGQTVVFTNRDDDAHTVTATDGSFDSKGLDTNGVWRHTFGAPGTYTYFCELHPFMKGTIVVKTVTP
ncbi:MAG: cupredoxin family copper-binding protein [Candidatus Baltobacteraceae bacterium]